MFKPKYSMKPTAAGRMFRQIPIVDMVSVLNSLGIELDFSNCTNFQYMLDNASITTFPNIDMSSAGNFTDGFRYAKMLQTVSLTNVKNTVTWSNSFTSCGSLVNFSITGTIGKVISFAHCSLLSAASVQNIIDCLADLTGQTAQTITFHSTVGNALTDAQKSAIAAKNWTLAY